MNKEYSCKYCGKTPARKNWQSFICVNCQYKKRYFGGLYWQVLERDKYCCVNCKKSIIGVRGSNVHHKNHNPKDNRLENLQTLCVSCHYKKRRMKCKDCKNFLIANNPRQIRCKNCGIKHEQMMSYRRQAKYWKIRNKKRYEWYISRIAI